jgi:hypothetical protein
VIIPAQTYNVVKVKVKHSRYRPEQAQRVESVILS